MWRWTAWSLSLPLNLSPSDYQLLYNLKKNTWLGTIIAVKMASYLLLMIIGPSNARTKKDRYWRLRGLSRRIHHVWTYSMSVSCSADKLFSRPRNTWVQKSNLTEPYLQSQSNKIYLYSNYDSLENRYSIYHIWR